MEAIRGIVLKITSVTTFIVMASLTKVTSDHVPAGEAIFFRSFFALPVILVWLIFRGELKTGLKTSRPMQHLWRGLVGTVAMGLGFTGLGLLPLTRGNCHRIRCPIINSYSCRNVSG